MPIRLQKELQKLKKRILSLGTMAEERVRMAIQAVQTRDATLAMKIVDADNEIDESEVEVEEECLKLLALYQPVAVDLRFLTAVIKINNDLERIGDQAVNIAERVATIARRPPVKVPFDYKSMAEKTEAMLRESLDALVNLDADLAYKVCLKDDEVDDMNREIYDKVKDAIRSDPERVGYLINLLLVSRHLERIADLATNIAEEVIYMVEGELSRHKMKEFGVSSH
jgi:phosphate transport system protein